jgi:hypothetical protein
MRRITIEYLERIKRMEELDPRQIKFLEYYLDVKSETFANALQSGLKAGYAQEYSESITSLMPKWLSERLGDMNLVNKAERNLNKFLSDDFKNDKIKSDITKFTLSRLNKQKYSDRVEHTGAEGRDLVLNINSSIAKKNGIY